MSGKQYKPSFFEKNHPGKDLGEGSKPIEPKGKEGKEEEDRVLMQLKVYMGLAYGLLKEP